MHIKIKGDVLMSNAVFYVSFKLKKEASVPDFLRAAEKLNDEYMSKQKGYISWQQLVDGETWADIVNFETMEDAKRVANPSGENDLAEKFYSFINLSTCKVHLFSVERNYGKHGK
jgi:hypothetical protein